jgi:Major Facilitator Superfamily.
MAEGDAEGVGAATMAKYVAIFGLMNAAWSLMWNLYGTYVPIYLQSGNPAFSNHVRSPGFGLNAMWASVFMSIDEALGMLLGPLIGILSDRAHKRVPFVLASVALAVLGVIALPFAVQAIPAEKSGHFTELVGVFAAFFAAALSLIVGHASISSPDSCLKMELVPSAQRSKIMGFISAVGVVLSLSLLAVTPTLYRLDPKLPFLAAATIAVIAALMYKLFLREPEGFVSEGEKEKDGLGILAKIRLLAPEEQKSLAFMLLCWFLGGMGVNSTTTFASSYAVKVLKMGEADTMYLVVACLAGSFVAYIPAGFLASKLGRFTLLRLGMLGISISGLFAFLFPVKVLVFCAVFVLGVSAAMITVTILPILSDIAASRGLMGSIAGAFVFVGLANAIVGNLVCGGAILATGSYNSLWLIVVFGGLGGFLSAALPARWEKKEEKR